MYQALPAGFDGYNGLISPLGSHVAVGRGTVSVINRLTQQVEQSIATARPMGWFNDYILVYQQYEDNCDVVTLDLFTRESHIISSGQFIQMGAAANNHWVGGYAAGKKVVRDGRLLSQGLDWFCGTDGNYTVILSETFIYIFGGTLLIHTLPLPAVTRYYPIVREGYCGFGRNGQPHLVNCASGVITNESVTKYNESEPCFSSGWIATAIERPNPIVAIRPVGTKECITLAVPEGCVGVDFKIIGLTGIVVTWSSTGQAVIQNFDITQERHLIDTPVVTPTYLQDYRAPNPIGAKYEQPLIPDPVIAQFTNHFHFGSFYVATHKYLNNDDWSVNKPWLTAPGNCCVVAGEPQAAVTAPYNVIITPDAIFSMGETPELWDRVVAIYLTPEMAADPIGKMDELRYTCKKLMDLLGLDYRPFIVYNADRPAVELIEEDTWIALQFYLSEGQPLSYLHELSDFYRQVIPTGTSVVIIGQTYDRNGTYTGELLPILETMIPIVRVWQPKAWLNFSDGRGSVANNYGGVRWHPELYPTLRGIMNAIPGE